MLESDRSLVWLFLPTLCAVDGFIAISGWFGVNFRWGKVARLLGQIVFYGFGFGLLAFGLGEGLRFHLGAGWFGVAYLALLFVAPLINAGLDSLQATGRLLSAYCLLALAFFVSWLSGGVGLGLTVSGWLSHSMATVLFVYVTARVLALSQWRPRAVGMLSLGGGVALVLFGVYYASLTDATGLLAVTGKFGWYNNPAVLLSALALLLLFERWNPPRILARIVTFSAPSMFAVYLLHDANALGGRLFIRKPIAMLVDRFGHGCDALIAVGWSLLLFVGLVGLDVCIRRLPLSIVIRAWRCLAKPRRARATASDA